MHKRLWLAILFFAAPTLAFAHDITTRVTWNREISRIVYARCASCHRQGGEAFSLVSFQEAQPWARAIKDSVLTRRMPPWGAVKGFGAFRNEESLTQEEMDLFALWVNGGTPEGNPDHLPLRPMIPQRVSYFARHDELDVGDDYRFSAEFTLDGFAVRSPPTIDSTQIIILFPDGRVEPLVWLNQFKPRREPFLLKKPIKIPAGATLNGLAGAKLTLLQATSH